MTDEQLDSAFREYFRREVPPPAISELPGRARGSHRSHFVLAASLAALAGLGLWLSSNASPRETARGTATKLIKGAEADGKKILDHVDMP